MRFNVTVGRADGNAGLNMNTQVEAPNLIDALELAKELFRQNIEAAGLSMASSVPAAPAAPQAPAPPAGA